MNVIRNFFLLILLAAIPLIPSAAYAKSEYPSFVYEMIDKPRVFDEDPADEFLAEKREINKLILQAKNGESDIKILEELYSKLKLLSDKTTDKYGKRYASCELLYGISKYWSMYCTHIVDEKFQSLTSAYNQEELKQKLKDEKTWRAFDKEFENLFSSFGFTPEMQFKIDKKYVAVSESILGESDPMTLKNMLRLIEDYSALGDSKTALAMAHDILPKIKFTFGERSAETADILNLMSKDYKVLGNYVMSEECLLSAMDINKELYGEENSPKVLSNVIDLIILRKVAVGKHHPLYKALEKAAKGISEDDLYKLGYFRIMQLMNPEKDNKEQKNPFKREYQIQIEPLKEIYKKSSTLSGKNLKEDAELTFELSQDFRKLSLEYNDINERDLLAFEFCRSFLGNNHHKTLIKLCDLSDDYLVLKKIDDALKLAQEALKTSRQTYGDEHPCTIYAIHSLTNVYRAMGRYSDALSLDLQAYDIGQRVFSKNSALEPVEILTVLEDISNDYKGLKDYESAIKYAEELFSKYESKIPYFDISYSRAEARKNLTYLYNISGNYEKTVALYGFLNENYKVTSVEKIFSRDSIDDCYSAFILSEALANIGKIGDAKYFYFHAIQTYEAFIQANKNLQDEEKNRLFTNALSNYKVAATFFLNHEKSGENKSKLFESNVLNLKLAISNVIEQKYGPALMTAELCKARNLSELYSELLLLYSGGLSEDEISRLNGYQEKISKFQDKINAANSYNLKFQFRLAQLFNINTQVAYKKYLQEKYPRYKNPYILDAPKDMPTINRYDYLKFSIQYAAILERIIPKNCCYISFLVFKKEDILNKQSNEILAFVANEKGEINGLSIPVDNNFLNNCSLYRNLLAYTGIDSMKRDGKYLWKLSDGSYKITNNRQTPAPNAVNINNAKDLANIRQKLSAQIGDTLLAPLSQYISSKPNWIISPDGELNTIPFETLQFNGKMAIDSANISYVPSLVVLTLMNEMGEKNAKLQNRKDIFAMGNAVYGNNDYAESRGLQIKFLEDIKRSSDNYVDLTKMKWANLPGTGEELNNVSALFAADKKEILSGMDASERNLKQRDKDGQLSQYKYILFAAHGLFLPEKPEYSSIVLSQGLADENYDGYVTIGEWFGYNLNSDLVYLSACESGLGDYQSGEGIIGLPYALTMAGNKDTVMSLWKIDDEAAAEFAAVFFTKLKKGKTEIQALNETKREFLSSTNPKFNTPSVWAAFLLYGI